MNCQQKLDILMEQSTDGLPVLLHSCCAVCSSYVLEYLAGKFSVTVLYYNPNIYPNNEYLKRKNEQKRLINETEYPYKVSYIELDNNYGDFISYVSGLQNSSEGGARCVRCFELRLEKTAELAAKGSYGFFATTLTVSPHKNANDINRVGEQLAAKYGVPWLYSDFKKKDGYLRSVRLAEQYNLYRQNYCGCEFSLNNNNY